MYEWKTRVCYSDADEAGRLSAVGMINALQDCCTLQAEDLGIGLSYLREHHLGWFVTNYQIKILRPLPSVGDPILVHTWPHHFRGMLGYRNFTITDETGEAYVMADSLWVLMNLAALRPVRLPQEMIDAYEIEAEIPGDWDLRKRLLPDQTEDVYDFLITPMHLDTNGHMNNAYYMAAAQACLDRDDPVREMRIEYRKASQLGEHLFCKKKVLGDETLILLCAANEECRAVVTFVRG